MYRQITPTLLVILGLASWVDAGFAVSIQRAARPVIVSTTVDADKNIMVVRGQHFGGGSPVVAVGNRVLRVKRPFQSRVVVEIPTGVAPSSYRLIVRTTGPDKQSSEPSQESRSSSSKSSQATTRSKGEPTRCTSSVSVEPRPIIGYSPNTSS